MKLASSWFFASAAALSSLGISFTVHGRQEPPPVPGLQISVHPVMPVLVKNPQVSIKYCNASDVGLTITPPVNEYLRPRKDSCALLAKADGKEVAQPKLVQGEVIAPSRLELRPGRTKELHFRLLDFPDRLPDWSQLEVRVMKCWFLRASTTASFVLYRNPQLKQQLEEGILQIAVRAEMQVDPADPQLIVHYCNTGNKDFLRLLLPRSGRAPRELTADVDGAALGAKSETANQGADPTSDHWSHLLGPGESVEVHARLFPVGAVPKDWKRIEVSVKKNNEFEASIYSTLILERHEPKRLYGNPPPAKP